MFLKVKVVFFACLMAIGVRSDECNGYQWKRGTSEDVAKYGLKVGSVYVGGASHGGQAAPGSIVLSQGLLYPYGGSVHTVRNYDYLVDDGNFKWVPSSDGSHIKNAVLYGFMGVPVGRTKNQTQVGKVCGPRCMYYASGRSETKAEEYDVLTYVPRGKK